eukprot:TRINITY_DN16412_c0_g1_i2.p1 TRINITY_DN16412_c0_g1~~TRINITY_DN16412_c0_g1_i2.p1  ORF type:complete len:444 (+),score=39.10 TRINITY_DN16412_c0_g1_i2:49-1380(+)
MRRVLTRRCLGSVGRLPAYPRSSCGGLCSSSTAAAPGGLTYAARVVGGVGVFAAIDSAAGHCLNAAGLQFPSSIAGLLGLAAVCAPAKTGRLAAAALGPAAAWLRAGLPIFLTPPIMYPVVAELPTDSVLARVLLLAALSLLFNTALYGRLATAAGSGAVPSSAVCSSASRAAAALSSPWVAGGLLAFGAAASAGAAAYGADSAAVRGPMYAAFTFAAATAGHFLPTAVRRLIPPPLVAGVVSLVTVLCIGGSVEAGLYIDGAGKLLMCPVPAAVVTLGLYSHTHKPMLMALRGPLLAACALGAPASFLLPALCGRLLSLDPCDIASVLPASTTTGLAMTMPSGMCLIREEWVAMSTLFNGLCGLVFYPATLWIAGFAGASAIVRGVSVGSVSHVAGMAALSGRGEQQASEVAAVALVIVGTTRCLLVQQPQFIELLSWCCGA